MPFDPDKYLAEKAQTGFDPDAYLQSKGAPQPPQPPQVSGLEAFGRGAAQGATLGFADELTGAGEAGADALTGKAQSLQALLDSYRKHRDEARAANQTASAQHPWLYGGGTLAGGAATALVPGMAFGGGVKGAAALGGLYGLGSSNADLTKGEVGKAAIDTGVGAGTGAVIGKATEFLNPELNAEKAEDLAVKHLRPTPKVADQLGEERLRDIGREALDSGAIKFGSRVGNTANNLNDLREAAGNKIGEMVENAPGSISPQDVAQKAMSDVVSPLEQTSETSPLAEKMKEKLSGFVNHYGESMTPAQVEAEKTAVQGNINYRTDAMPWQQAQKDWARVLRETGESMIDDPAFKAAKRAYGNLSSAQEMAERTAGLTSGGTGLNGHLTDLAAYNIAGQGAMHGNPAALPIAATRYLTKGRMASAGAVTLNALSNAQNAVLGKVANALQENPQALGRFGNVLQDAATRGGDSLAVTHYLLNKTEPAYQEILNKLADRDKPSPSDDDAVSLKQAQQKFQQAQ